MCNKETASLQDVSTGQSTMSAALAGLQRDAELDLLNPAISNLTGDILVSLLLTMHLSIEIDVILRCRSASLFRYFARPPD